MNNYNLINCDSDGACFGKNNENINIDEVKKLVSEFNKTIPQGIEVEFEAFMPALVVAKSKNYAMLHDNGDITIKGSAFKSSSKEPALREMCELMLQSMLGLLEDTPVEIYHRYVREVRNILDINRWSSKTTYTQAVEKAGRLQEEKKKRAAESLNLSLGDKYFVYIKEDGWLGVPEDFDGSYCVKTYLGKIYNAIKPLASVMNLDDFPNYKLKRNQEKLQQLAS